MVLTGAKNRSESRPRAITGSYDSKKKVQWPPLFAQNTSERLETVERQKVVVNDSVFTSLAPPCEWLDQAILRRRAQAFNERWL